MRTCPWCHASLPPPLGFIDINAPTGIPFIRPARKPPLVCPSCGKGLRWGIRGQLWLALVLPFVIAAAVSVVEGPDSVSMACFAASFLLAWIGVALGRRCARFEKRET